MEVARGVYRPTDGRVNWYVVEDGGKLTVVDAGIPGDWSVLLKTLASLGRTPGDVEAVLLTHAHPDHIGFAERARTEVGAAVYVHEADQALAQGKARPRNQAGMARYLLRPATLGLLLYFVRRGALRSIPVREASTFRDSASLDLPGRPTVVHAPGHSAGSCALYLPERRVLFSGDVLATRNPLTGRRGPQIMPGAFNESSARAMDSLARIEEIDAGTILPGHGEPWTGGVREAVRLAREAGPS